ncbi:MAG TPA: hypothetical protein VIU93_03450 [Gallionellaceae bacterium]
MRNLPPPDTGLPSLLRKVLAIALAVTVLTLVFMFSLVLIAVILLAGAIAWGYLLWKTRHLRRQMRAAHAHARHATTGRAERHAAHADVIEGEVVRVYRAEKTE